MDEEIRAFYETGAELDRLSSGASLIEFIRTKEVLERELPPLPARVLDVGGGPGAYADWLAGLGYNVRLVDATPLHVEEARRRAGGRFEAVLGDARALDEESNAWDVVLLLGPLYHLIERRDRVAALRDARRVVRRGGLVAAAAISRFASLLDTLARGIVRQPDVWAVTDQDLKTGVHRSPKASELFTTAYFHRPEELRAEVEEAGLELDRIVGLEGPGWLRTETVNHDSAREDVLHVARAVETECSLVAASAHLLAIARA